MAIDPRNYDLDELRAASVGQPSLGGRDGWSEEVATADAETAAGEASDGADRPAAAVAFEAAIARDLAALDGDVERPYLPALPASFPAEALIFEWLDFLVTQADHGSVTDAFEFYEQVGWLGRDAAGMLDRYLSGVDRSCPDTAAGLDADDHRVSLHYIARLAALSQR
jgi:archaellum component FlaD/FlaE